MKSHVDFVHLHCHTQYSLLDAASKVDELVKRAVELRFPALAMTDHGNLFGAIEFYSAAMKQGIKPIIGMEAYIAPGSRFEKQAHGIKEASFHVTLLAKNETGYKNLMKLTSIGYLEGFYYRPRIDKESLKQYSDGLICLSGCLKGEVAYYIRNEQPAEARRAIEEFLEIFTPENYYLELMDQSLAPQKKVNGELLKFSKDYNVRLVATNDSHYVYKQNAQAHDALICIGTGSQVTDTNRMRYEGDNFYLKSAEEMKELFRDFPDAIKNTVDIADRCNLELDFKKTHLPKFDPPKGKTLGGYFEELCYKLMKDRLEKEIPENYLERLKYELSVIGKMGYTSYFLIVWDFIRYAKENRIPVGPGRGSAAGSLVAYALSITDVDPIQNNLIFERFLNPDRVSMPDIDIDFCYERRDEVIEYVRRKYGMENVAQIITFGTMAAKAAVRDVGRVLGFSYPEVDRLAKLIPQELNITLKLALEREPKLKELIAEDSRIAQLFETSRALEGLARHASTHAAGVVISDKPLTEYVPLFKTEEQISTQYTMKDLEKIGLLKMDFLGLKTLTMIDQTLKIIARTQQQEIDIQKIPLDDKAAYEMLGRAEAAGVFQLESSGMRDLLRKMKPNCFDHIVALLALYRPGPLGSGMVDDFIKRMHDPSKIQYDHSTLEPILKETYGVILYQEQVMQIVSAMAGFTLAQADSLRRAIGKKIPEIMEKEKKNFIDGSVKNGVKEKVAEKIWNLIDYFSGYGFNKSHSTAYALISYQTAYLKAHYPLEFMTALLTSEMGNTNKVVRYIEECKKMGIEVKPPSVNESFSEFTCSAPYIRFGLTAVKNVGSTAIESILSERRKDGPFKSLKDFTQRVDLRVCNRKVMESLIKCGAFDEFRLRRSQLMAMLDRSLDMASNVQKDKSLGQLSFFGQGGAVDESLEGDVPDIPEWPEGQLLAYERELTGFYVSAHPLSKHTKILKNYATATTETLSEFKDQAEVSIGGIVDGVREILTKKGDKMAFVNLQDLHGNCEVVVFPEAYKTYQALIKKDSTVFVKGKINLRDDVPKILADEIILLDDVKKRWTKLIHVDLNTIGLDAVLLAQIKKALQLAKGMVPVYLSFKDAHGKMVTLHAGEDLKVQPKDELFEALEEIVGESNVKIK